MNKERTAHYYRAARFPSAQVAGDAYLQAHNVFVAECQASLSLYRFKLNDVWYVAIVGELPGQGVDQGIEAALSAGEPVALSDDLLSFLLRRREEQSPQAPRVEVHFRPGRFFQV